MTEDTSGGPDTKIIYKDADSGLIVSEEYARRHPKRTYSLEVPENTHIEEGHPYPSDDWTPLEVPEDVATEEDSDE